MGGSRHERKKWIHQFNSADVILFVVSLSEFDTNCFEDGETPRWKESFDIFMNLLYNPSFAKLPFVLLFNKKDVLEQKLVNQSFASHFDDFPSDKNGQNIDDCIQFIVDKYSSSVKTRQLLLNPGECCVDPNDENAGPSMLVRVLNAFDENNLLTVFKDITEYSIREHQRRYLQALVQSK
ncbi:predicted protein [Naegleria gruberi]|uniref:Predicted protein n=1 Tax=Naegleria gruberi TaxID=5762 RepID=D2W0G4_NAEGR|nr:uncharacterized protein NAEGRDRAFT_74848 [Naegleria gruberi]EFC37473.1 predicted protein [Naegleria gruberi]|eukprot:XP_002670217.1 predicted protein [Naegleria gruberi strain NEG-M]